MEQSESIAILSALTPEVLAERQRIVDAAVRAARSSGYCETFNEMLDRVMPEMVVHVDGYPYAFNSDGVDCHGYTVERRMRQSETRRTFGPDGFDQNGFDRDGFNRQGYDAEGYDAEGRGRAYMRDRRPYSYDRNGNNGSGAYVMYTPELGTYDRERLTITGYGQYTNLDRDGNLRVGRGPTPEEAEAEARPPVLFNPTTWTPETVTVG